MKPDKPQQFKDYSDRLLPLLDKRLSQLKIRDEKGFSLVGLTTHFIQNEFGDNANINIGGKNLPVVIVVGNSTAIVYSFALKPLLDELEEIDGKK